MRRMNFFRIIVSLFILCSTLSVFAWTHGVSIGYGGGSDINHHTYTNSGIFLSGEFLSIKQKSWLNITFNGSMGQFFTTEPVNKNLFTAALSLAFRFYAFQSLKVHPFLLASFGPAYLSDRKFGLNNQAANVAIQSILGLGFEFGQAKRVDLNMRFIHYSNAYTMHPNEGYNIFYVVSLGYLF